MRIFQNKSEMDLYNYILKKRPINDLTENLLIEAEVR